MNALTSAGSSTAAVAALQGLRQGLQNVRQTIVSGRGDPFLRLMKSGRWVYGQENENVEPGSQWAINPLSIKYGFASWTRYGEKEKKPNELMGEVMVPATAPPVDPATLADTGWDWTQQVSFQLKCLTGEDAGAQTLYKTTSVGGLGASAELFDALMARTDDKVVPIVTLEHTTYQHKTYGETATPIFKVVKWVSMDELAATAEEPASEPEQVAAPEPAKRTRTRSTPAVTNGAEHRETITITEDEELARLEQMVAAKKAAKAAQEAQAAEPVVDEKAARRAALLKQMAELDEGSTPATPVEGMPAPGQPIRRRRS
jgi:hypothetical protein